MSSRATVMTGSTAVVAPTFLMAGRELTREEVETVAQGRVWTGNQALERKLVDDLGGLPLAIENARELSKTDSGAARIRFYPKEEDLVSYVLRRLDKVATRWSQSLFNPLGDASASELIEFLKLYVGRRDYVRAISPVRADF